MNIEEEFLKFIEFPEGSDGMYVTTVSAKLFAKHCAGYLEQERDECNADVIEAAISDAEQKLGMVCHNYRCVKVLRHIREYANQLRQKHR